MECHTCFWTWLILVLEKMWHILPCKTQRTFPKPNYTFSKKNQVLHLRFFLFLTKGLFIKPTNLGLFIKPTKQNQPQLEPFPPSLGEFPPRCAMVDQPPLPLKAPRRSCCSSSGASEGGGAIWMWRSCEGLRFCFFFLKVFFLQII